jgi:hypothetical protein
MYFGRGTAARWWAVVAVMVSMTLSGGLPAAADPGGAVAIDEIYARLGIDQVPSDYVVMVDVSGSMKGERYAQVRRSLTEFFAALAPEDRVTLIPFADRAPASTQQVGRAPGKLLAKLPADADGGHTDIGAALESAVTALSRGDAPPLATVVLLTDGRHDPGPNSAYPLTAGHNWTVLTGRARKLRKTSLQAYAIPLSGATGAPLLAKVFPGARILGLASVDKLTATLARPKATARAAKARSILADELARPIGVTWPDGGIDAGRSTVDVKLTSLAPHVPLVLDKLAVGTGNPAVTASIAGGPVELAPGATITVPVTVDWDAGPRAAVPLKTVYDRVHLTLTAQVSSPWSAALGKGLGLSLDPDLAPAPVDQEVSAQRGSLWYWITGIALIVVLLVLAVRWRRGRLSPRLRGAVVVGDTASEPRTVPLSGHRVQLSADATGLPGSGEITAIRAGVGSAEVHLMITYSPDGSVGSRQSAACSPGETVTVAGTPFTWQAAIPAQRARVSQTFR